MRIRPAKVVGVVLVLGGTILLALRIFGIERRESEADLGPIEVRVVERERIEVPAWIGAALIAAGGLLILMPGRRS